MNMFDATPGVLSDKQIKQLVEVKAISIIDGNQVEPDASALDLPITRNAWRIPHAVRPTNFELAELTVDKNRVTPDGDDMFTFRKNTAYLVELAHYLQLPKNVSGRATGRSSVGRLDIITRLIGGKGSEYDLVPAGYNGKLHLLVVPQTFDIKASVGTALNQLRLFSGSQFDSIISRSSVRHFGTPFWYFRNDGNFEPWPREEEKPTERDNASLIEDPYQLDLTVDLADPDEGYVFDAQTGVGEPIVLKKGENDPAKYFKKKPIQERSVTLDKDQFYILKSRERLHIPSTVAVEVVAISERIGDIRIHYAGFAHPEFGRDRPDDGKKGTPLIFEVRSTDMSTRLQDGTLLARVQLFRMSQAYVPKANGQEENKKSYNTQELQLSNYFSDWKRS